jgi:hypothetical protein
MKLFTFGRAMLLATGMFCLQHASYSIAAPVTFNFEGAVRSDSIDYAGKFSDLGITTGTLLKGSYTFDSEAVDTAANTSLGIYNMSAPMGFELEVGNIDLSYAGDYVIRAFSDSPGTYEVYQNTGFSSNGLDFVWFRILLQGIDLADDTLPLTAPGMDGATTALVQLWGTETPEDPDNFRNQWRIQMDLTSLSGGIDANAGTVSAPSAAWLLLGLLGPALRVRHKT